jgi:hypothetical protein
MIGTRYRIRTGVNAVKGHYPGPLDEPSKKKETTVAGPSAPKRKYPGDVVLKNWRSQGVTIPFFKRDRLVCVHEHFETKNSLYENTLGCLTEIAVLNLPYRAVHGVVCPTHYSPTVSGAIYSIHLAASFPSFMQLGRVCAATDYSLAKLPTGVGNPMRLHIAPGTSPSTIQTMIFKEHVVNFLTCFYYSKMLITCQVSTLVYTTNSRVIWCSY